MMNKIKYGLTLSLSLLTMSVFAQATEKATSEPASISSNPLFISMGVLTAVLLFVIVILAGVLKTSVKTKVREIVNSKALGLALLLLPSIGAFAQNDKPESLYVDTPIGGMHPMAFYSLFVVLLLELFVILWLCLMILRIIVKREAASAAAANEPAKKSAFSTFISRKIFGVKPVETDKDVLLDHDYDGIKELDNDLPPWWKYGFYLTIITGIIYLTGYHITGSFKLQAQEYETDVAEAEAAVNAYKAKMALNVDESNAVFLTDADKVAKGKDIFMKNCVACHGNAGEGKIGPNLTDEYWLYGGSAGDVFKTVKYGTNKGMQAWKESLSPVDMQNVISFIHTLKGTNPPNAKAAEGKPYAEGASSTANDSTTNKQTTTDSSKSLEVKP